MNRHELIIFDWDGTLMDSVAKIVRCFSAALADTDTPDPGEAAIRHIIGLGLEEAMTALLPASFTGNPIIYPDPKALAPLEFGAAVTLTDPNRAEIWARFKSA